MKLQHLPTVTTVILAALFSSVSAQTVHNATVDFSITNGNPNGVWSYGTLPATPGTTFTAFAATATGDLNVWRPTGVTTLVPSVARNETGAVFNAEVSNGTISTDTLGVVKLQPGEMMLNPGLSNTRVAVRFTAPQNAVYRFQGSFSNAAEENGAEVITMLHKGTVELFNVTWNVSGSSPLPTGAATARPFDVSIPMNAGETVDVSVAPNSTGRDSVGLSLTATQLAPGSVTDQRWTGGTGDWSNGAKWNFGVVPLNNQPDSGDLYNATFDSNPGNAPTNATLDVPIQVQRLTLGFPNLNNLTFNLLGPGALTIHDRFNWNRGTLNLPGGVTLAPTSTTEMFGSGSTSLTGTTLLNQGDMNVRFGFSGGLNMAASGAVQPSVLNSGTLTMHGQADMNGTGSFTNQASGTLVKAGAALDETVVSSGIIFTNNGLVQVDGGVLRLTNGTHTGSYQIASGAELQLEGTHSFNGAGVTVNGDGTLVFNRDTTTLNAPLTVNSNMKITRTTFGGSVVVNQPLAIHGTFTQNGSDNGLTGPSTVTLHGPVDWRSGTMSGSGTTTIAAGVVADLTTASGKSVSARTLINNGTMNIQGATPGFTTGAVLTNNGTIDLKEQFGLTGNSGSPVFNNAGTLKKTGIGNGTASVVNFTTFNNTGIIDVEVGQLTIGRSFAPNPPTNHTDAELLIANGAFLSLDGDHAFDATTTITGPGKLLLNNDSTITFNGTGIDAPVEFSDGLIRGNNYEFRGGVEWKGGTFDTAGTTLNAAGSTINLTTGSARSIANGRTFRNLGTMNVGAIPFNLSSSSIFENGGLLVFSGNAGSLGFSGGGNKFRNLATGTIRKTGVGTTSTISS